MNATEIAVVVGITVRGGYSPDLIRIEAGKPVRLRFDRQENSDCSARVVFPDLRKSASLAAFGNTTLDLDIPEPGQVSPDPDCVSYAP